MTAALPPPLTPGIRRPIDPDRLSVWAVAGVGATAITLSFTALLPVAEAAGLGWAAPLLPVLVDGFGLACSLRVAQSAHRREPFRERLIEWVGLAGALTLSILGNVHHAMMVGSPTLPTYLRIAFAVAAPVIVAYSVHVYGRAMHRAGTSRAGHAEQGPRIPRQSRGSSDYDFLFQSDPDDPPTIELPAVTDGPMDPR